MFLLLASLLQAPLTEQETRDLGSLVEALDAERIEDREEAWRKLRGFGPRALPFLKESLKTAGTNLRAELVALIDALSTVELSAVLDRVRAAADAPGKGAEGEVWALLEKLLNKVSAATHQGMDLPTRWAAHKVQVSKDARVAHLRDSILLVDGCARISHAHNSIIVATGAVSIGHATRVLVLAGPYLSVGFTDIRSDEDEKAVGGSLLLGGSRLRVSHAAGALCGAPEGVRISHANQVMTVNSNGVEFGHSKGGGSVTIPGVALGGPAKNPLEGRIEVTASVEDEGKGGHVLVRVPGLPGEYSVREGDELKEPSGKPFPGTEGWKLIMADRHFALFGDGKSYAGFPLKKPE